MARTETVTCDQCGANLTSTGNCEGWRIVLANQRIPSRGSVVTAMAKYPHLNQDYYFCGTRCLSEWAKKNI